MYELSQQNLEKWLSYRPGDLIQNPKAKLPLITVLDKDGLVLILSDPSDSPNSSPLSSCPLTYSCQDDEVRDYNNKPILKGVNLKEFLDNLVIKEGGMEVLPQFRKMKKGLSMSDFMQKNRSYWDGIILFSKITRDDNISAVFLINSSD